MSLKLPARLLASTAFLLASPAMAEPEAAYPTISGEAVFELQTEHGYDSDDADKEITNTFGRMEVAPTLAFNEHVFVDGVLVFEPVQDPDWPGRDVYFENEGTFIEELKLNYENGPWYAFIGKFNPVFGIAWDYGRGIWSEEFAEDYEITEKLGFGGSYTVGSEESGFHTLTASTFFADTGFLTRSKITGRGEVDKSDGGAGNTEDFSSFVLSLDGEDIAGIEDLSYVLAFRHLGADDIGGEDEDGIAANVNYVFTVSENVTLDTLVEFAGVDNLGGGLDDYRYYTGNVIARFCENWNVTLGYTARNIELAGGGDVNDHLVQLTGGYDFGNGLTLEAGWRGAEEAGVDTGIVGGLARYTLEF